MTKRGTLTELDEVILAHLTAVGPLTTKELQEDLDDVDRAAYGRLIRLHRLGRVHRFQMARSTAVLWSSVPK